MGLKKLKSVWEGVSEAASGVIQELVLFLKIRMRLEKYKDIHIKNPVSA